MTNTLGIALACIADIQAAVEDCGPDALDAVETLTVISIIIEDWMETSYVATS